MHGSGSSQCDLVWARGVGQANTLHRTTITIRHEAWHSVVFAELKMNWPDTALCEEKSFLPSVALVHCHSFRTSIRRFWEPRGRNSQLMSPTWYYLCHYQFRFSGAGVSRDAVSRGDATYLLSLSPLSCPILPSKHCRTMLNLMWPWYNAICHTWPQCSLQPCFIELFQTIPTKWCMTWSMCKYFFIF